MWADEKETQPDMSTLSIGGAANKRDGSYIRKQYYALIRKCKVSDGMPYLGNSGVNPQALP